ncbi:hypothetical protein F4779DRAFT_271940 [Xylariaceae sp. FL0662B]|nr:hypothetical protein F4779DRAFT_271940 [Xylariaceae sp. FL0662B]
MSLVLLPFEVITEIFSYVDDQEVRKCANNGRPTLFALSLTCRRLSEVAISLLYRNIKLEIRYAEAHDRTRIIKLNHILRANPSLVDQIHYAEIRWWNSRVGSEIYNEFLGHLARSSSLTKLTSELGNTSSCVPLPALYEYTSGSFSRLKSLEVGLSYLGDYDCYMPAERLVKLCELPHLETLTVRAPITAKEFRTNTILSQDTISLKHLHFWSCHHVSSAVLESILPRAPNLTCLHLNIPGEAAENTRMYSGWSSELGDDMNMQIHSTFYARVMATATVNLTNLVVNVENRLDPDPKGPRIDLSCFTSLSRLSLSSNFLFGKSRIVSSCPWSQDVWKFLPPRLDTLRVRFDGYGGLFWSFNPMRSHARKNTFDELWKETLNYNALDWLVKIIHTNRGYNNLLRSVIIEETAVVHPDQNCKIVNWHVTDPLEMMAKSVGVELSIRLRVPRNFECSEFDA